MKIHAGAPVIEPGMEEQDFRDLAEAGVTLLGEVGLGGVKDGPTARRMVAWGPPLRHPVDHPHRRPVDPGLRTDRCRGGARSRYGRRGPHQRRPHGPARPRDPLQSARAAGAASRSSITATSARPLYTMRLAREMGQLDRVILGTDGPAGSGVQPLGIVRMIAMLSAIGEVPAETAFCFGTGNTATMRSLDCGILAEGRAADSHLPRPSAALGRQDAAPSGGTRRSSRDRHGGDRRARPHRPQPQHAPGRDGPCRWWRAERVGSRGTIPEAVADQGFAISCSMRCRI